MTKDEHLNIILDRHVFQRANEIYPFLAENHGEAYSDCWANMWYDDDELAEQIIGFKDMSEEDQEEALEELRDSGEDYKEIREYWLVSDWLYEQLDRSKAPVLEFNGLYFYGRTGTGQALTMDYYLNKVATRLANKF